VSCKKYSRLLAAAFLTVTVAAPAMVLGAEDKPTQPQTPEERERAEMQSVTQKFEEQTKEYKKEVQQFIERKYNEQRASVMRSYEHSITELEKDVNQRRAEAIEIYEKFLAKYPNETVYTPSALWRLADLYFEKSELEYTADNAAFQKALKDFSSGERKVEPTPPEYHYEKTVGLLQRLIQEFPTYNLLDGAYYLLAYCLQEQGESEEAQNLWVVFVDRFPKSKLLPDVWTRLGESYFENPNKLDKAIRAYQQVLAYPKSPLYDKALYKLAWTYYKVDRFDDAVERFDQLISWADKTDAEKKEDDVSKSELRAEAMQYLAISFTEDSWENSGVENAKAFFKKLGGRKYEGEFFRKLGELFFIDAKYPKSIEANREALRMAPTDPVNPTLMASIIESYLRLHQEDDATKAREELVKLFGPESVWRKANQDNPEALHQADKFAENALEEAAVRHHLLAQRYRQDRPEDALREYTLAAEAYGDYLKRFPEARNAYDRTFFLAECYYYSKQYVKAAEVYAQVRDSVAGNSHLAEASYGVVDSYNNLIKSAESDGSLAPLKIFTKTNRPKDLEIKARPIPELLAKYVAAVDAYVAKMPNDDQTPHLSLRAAQIFFAHDQFDQARERLNKLVSETKNEDVLTSGINLIIESYLVSEDWTQVEQWSKKLATLTRNTQQRQELKGIEVGARFKKAEGLMKTGSELRDKGQQSEAEKSLDAAAEEFVRLVNDEASNKDADAALNNAAVCYTWSNRPVAAGKIFERIVAEYPKSKFADKALYMVAQSADSSFQFQKAIDSYLKLVDAYTNSQFRADSLYNAAVDLEGDQQYERASKAYERYATTFKDRPDAAENFFRSGLVLERYKDWKNAIAVFTRFIQNYRHVDSEKGRIVQAQMKIAEAYQELGDQRRAQQGYEETIKQFNAFKLPVGTAGGPAAEAVAKSTFQIADADIKGYESTNFDVPEQKLLNTVKAKEAAMKKLSDKYKAVLLYKRGQWSLAAYYRLGYLIENYANCWISSPCPKGLDEESCDVYKGKVQEEAEKWIKLAIVAFEETLAKSKTFTLANEWTQKTMESLNRLDPLKYPLQKEPEAALVVDRFGAQPMLKVIEGGSKPEGK
jgi:TolA-binding protein